MSRRLPLMALMALTLLLAACGRSTPTRYYLLESAHGIPQADNLPATSLRVAPVNVPDYLNRSNIVSRVDGQTQLILAEFHLWAEPVSNGVRRVTQEALTRPMLERGITVLPSGTENTGDFVLELDIVRLDGNFDENAVLEARWTLLDRAETVLGRGMYAAEAHVDGATYSALVSVESRLVRGMAEFLAARLVTLLPDRRS